MLPQALIPLVHPKSPPHVSSIDLRQRLGQIGAPVLVISSQHHGLFSVEHSQEIA
jgi:hypothetical protein